MWWQLQVLASAEINSLTPQMPALTAFIKSLYECNYAEFFQALGKQTYLPFFYKTFANTNNPISGC